MPHSNPLSENQIAAMLSLQAGMNRKVDPDWVQAGYPYLRAVVIEGAEAIEHHGWKWWKKQTLDLPQLQMELIDIWHFILSALLLEQDGDEARTLAALMPRLAQSESAKAVDFYGETVALDGLTLLDKLELLIALSARRRIDLALFASVMADCQLDWPALYRHYIGKNMLNLFRQDNGYKEGRYRKHWNGREDNEHLTEILQRLDPAAPDYQDNIYQALADAYPEA